MPNRCLTDYWSTATGASSSRCSTDHWLVTKAECFPSAGPSTQRSAVQPKRSTRVERPDPADRMGEQASLCKSLHVAELLSQPP